MLKYYLSNTLRAIALFYISFPITYPILIGFWFHIPASKLLTLSLSPIYWFVVILAVVSGFGMLNAKRWSWYVFFVSSCLIIYENAYIASTHGGNQYSLFAFLITLLFTAWFVFRVGKELQVPYMYPKIKWWESDPNKKLSLPVRVIRNHQESEGEILDLGISGCFIKSVADYDLDEAVSIRFVLFGYDIFCEGNIVWKAMSAVTHPKGVGMRFKGLDKHTKRKLKICCKRLSGLDVYKNISSPIVDNKTNKLLGTTSTNGS